jgi:hypothetical protein
MALCNVDQSTHTFETAGTVASGWLFNANRDFVDIYRCSSIAIAPLGLRLKPSGAIVTALSFTRVVYY